MAADGSVTEDLLRLAGQADYRHGASSDRHRLTLQRMVAAP